MLEARKIQYNLFMLRGLEALYTPEARGQALEALVDPNATTNTIVEGMRRARHTMWAKFVWQQLPDLDPEKRMPLSFPFVLEIRIFLFK